MNQQQKDEQPIKKQQAKDLRTLRKSGEANKHTKRYSTYH